MFVMERQFTGNRSFPLLMFRTGGQGRCSGGFSLFDKVVSGLRLTPRQMASNPRTFAVLGSVSKTINIYLHPEKVSSPSIKSLACIFVEKILLFYGFPTSNPAQPHTLAGTVSQQQSHNKQISARIKLSRQTNRCNKHLFSCSYLCLTCFHQCFFWQPPEVFLC